jgi:hypothetical protein
VRIRAIFSLLSGLAAQSSDPGTAAAVAFRKGTWRGSQEDLPNRSWQLFSYPFFREFRKKSQAFVDVAAIDSILFTTHGRVGESSSLENVNAELVSGTYFSVLGVNPILGRILTEADDQVPGGDPVAVASYSWWQRRFGKDPNVVGKSVTIRSTVYRLIGVAAPEFFGITVGQSPDIWIPLTMEKEISPGWNDLDKNLFQSLYIIARRKPDVSIGQASANTNLLFTTKRERVLEILQDGNWHSGPELRKKLETQSINAVLYKLEEEGAAEVMRSMKGESSQAEDRANSQCFLKTADVI